MVRIYARIELSLAIHLQSPCEPGVESFFTCFLTLGISSLSEAIGPNFFSFLIEYIIYIIVFRKYLV